MLKGISLSLLLISAPVAAQQVDCEKLGAAMSSGGYTEAQQQEMAAVYARECGPSPVTEPPTLNFTIRNNTGHELEVSFKSQQRDNWWPGGGQVYILQNTQVSSYKLSCLAGESICYGATVRNDFLLQRYWGAGASQEYGCSNCCYACGPNADTGVIRLTP